MASFTRSFTALSKCRLELLTTAELSRDNIRGFRLPFSEKPNLLSSSKNTDPLSSGSPFFAHEFQAFSPANSFIRPKDSDRRFFGGLFSGTSKMHSNKSGNSMSGLLEEKEENRLSNSIVNDVARQEHNNTNQAEQGGNEDEIDWKIKMLYDGDCPLCLREVDMLRERNREYKSIKFVDISDENYDGEENENIDFETAMGRIHAIGRVGTIWTNIEAFQKLYEAVGLGWVYSFTKYPFLAKAADAVYDFWAKYRLPITGRPPLEVVLEKRRREKEALECGTDGRCNIDS